ncbi:MAG: HAD family hydrolase [Butyrivibrio sp.]
MPYHHILFDIDNTLTDFPKSFAAAAKKVLTLGGHADDNESAAEYFRYNDESWFGFELDHIERADIRRDYHKLYNRYLYESTAKAKKEMNLLGSVEELQACFEKNLGALSVPSPHAVEVCRKLSENHTLSIATNGLSRVQPLKLTAFMPYISHVYVSEDVGRIKPEREYFEYILNDLGCEASDCIMVGDSLPNDIGGANGAGIASCYYNPAGKTADYDKPDRATGLDTTPKYMIKDFNELLRILS